MFHQLASGKYKVVSVSRGSPTSVEDEPQLPCQDIRLGLPCQTWTITIGEFGPCGYPYVGLKDDRVVASVERDDNRKWVIERASSADAYIFGLANGQYPQQVWTVSPEQSPNPSIVLRPFRGTTDQFFRFVRVDDA